MGKWGEKPRSPKTEAPRETRKPKTEARRKPETRILNIEHPTSNIEHRTLNFEF
jgi:hypothetical protein